MAGSGPSLSPRSCSPAGACIDHVAGGRARLRHGRARRGARAPWRGSSGATRLASTRPASAARRSNSTAENFSDGVVAPAIWFVLLGLPGLLAYKAINTANSMIGHLTPRHSEFGWAAARLDDLVNLPASRLAGCLIALARTAAGRHNRASISDHASRGRRATPLAQRRLAGGGDGRGASASRSRDRATIAAGSSSATRFSTRPAAARRPPADIRRALARLCRRVGASFRAGWQSRRRWLISRSRDDARRSSSSAVDVDVTLEMRRERIERRIDLAPHSGAPRAARRGPRGTRAETPSAANSPWT